MIFLVDERWEPTGRCAAFSCRCGGLGSGTGCRPETVRRATPESEIVNVWPSPPAEYEVPPWLFDDEPTFLADDVAPERLPRRSKTPRPVAFVGAGPMRRRWR